MYIVRILWENWQIIPAFTQASYGMYFVRICKKIDKLTLHLLKSGQMSA